MSQPDIQSTMRRGISTRSVVIVILLVGLGAGAVGYGLNNAFAATNPTQQTTTNGQQGSGLKGSPGWDHYDASTLGFRAISTVANVTANGFAFPESSHLQCNLDY